MSDEESDDSDIVEEFLRNQKQGWISRQTRRRETLLNRCHDIIEQRDGASLGECIKCLRSSKVLGKQDLRLIESIRQDLLEDVGAQPALHTCILHTALSVDDAQYVPGMKSAALKSGVIRL